MLSTMRRSWLLFALFALVALTSALKLESLNMDGIESYIHHGKKRQAPGTGLFSSTPTPSSTPSSTPSPSGDKSTPGPSSTPEPTSSPPPKESSTPPPSPSSTPPPSSDPTSTKPTTTRLTAPLTKSTPLVSTEILSYETVYTYISDGQTHVSTGVGQKTLEHTTGSLITTELPSPQNGTSSGDGLSTEKKSIIGGVVGGVGGALLLGGIAIVAWRIWGRKKRVTEDDDDLTFSTGSALGGDKSSPPSSANTPFKSNLEQYHNPGGRPNAAANF